jgi:hypothetical protein
LYAGKPRIRDKVVAQLVTFHIPLGCLQLDVARIISVVLLLNRTILDEAAAAGILPIKCEIASVQKAGAGELGAKGN